MKDDFTAKTRRKAKDAMSNTPLGMNQKSTLPLKKILAHLVFLGVAVNRLKQKQKYIVKSSTRRLLPRTKQTRDS